MNKSQKNSSKKQVLKGNIKPGNSTHRKPENIQKYSIIIDNIDVKMIENST